MRTGVKRGLAWTGLLGSPRGATVLIYHRVGAGTRDERDLSRSAFAAQLEVLAEHEVVTLDDALARAAAGDDRPCVVLTFDDGFADVYRHAWPLLAGHRLPFTLYLTTAYLGGTMHWDGSTATAAGPGLSWPQLREMVDSGLCTVGNHTHTHCRPRDVDAAELDRCTREVQRRLGVTPQHFAWPWGVVDPRADRLVRGRFASAATGVPGRHVPGGDPLALPRVAVRGSDPLSYFRRAVGGGLAPVHAYERTVRVAKALGVGG